MTVESHCRASLQPRAVYSWLASFAVGSARDLYVTKLLSALYFEPVYGDD